MPSFNKEVQGNDFGFFKEEISRWWQAQSRGKSFLAPNILPLFRAGKSGNVGARQSMLRSEIPMPPPEPALSACHDI